jgi:DNA-binding LytR/AlgR family response regulator
VMVLIRIAIVEDEPTERDRIKVYLEEIAQEDQTQFDIEQYSSGMAFVMRGMKDYDLVLMDIDMPNLNGIETAKALRKVDQSATLIFVTNMAQYAISGYEVNAIDFILKPVNRYSFAIKIKRAISRTAKKNDNAIQIKMDGTIFLVHMYQIMYLEVDGHYVIFHTTQGDYKEYTTLKLAQKRINSSHFVQCNQSFLINMKYIESVSRESVTVGGTIIYISRKMKTEFMNAVLDFLGGMNP